MSEVKVKNRRNSLNGSDKKGNSLDYTEESKSVYTGQGPREKRKAQPNQSFKRNHSFSVIEKREEDRPKAGIKIDYLTILRRAREESKGFD